LGIEAQWNSWLVNILLCWEVESHWFNKEKSLKICIQHPLIPYSLSLHLTTCHSQCWRGLNWCQIFLSYTLPSICGKFQTFRLWARLQQIMHYLIGLG
jgi:hypothetical protein